MHTDFFFRSVGMKECEVYKEMIMCESVLVSFLFEYVVLFGIDKREKSTLCAKGEKKAVALW